jgi:hypothetical protein
LLDVLAAEAPKPDVAVSSNQSAGATKTNKEINARSSAFKPTVDSEENKEAWSSKDCHQRCQQRNEVVMKKRELAERQAAAAATATTADEESQQHEASDGVPVVPDVALVVPGASLSTSAADADLNSRIEEIFEEFQEMRTKIDVNDGNEV